jgi:hypothetical protein
MIAGHLTSRHQRLKFIYNFFSTSYSTPIKIIGYYHNFFKQWDSAAAAQQLRHGSASTRSGTDGPSLLVGRIRRQRAKGARVRWPGRGPPLRRRILVVAGRTVSRHRRLQWLLVGAGLSFPSMHAEAKGAALD